MKIAALALASIGLMAGVACQSEGGAATYEVVEDGTMKIPVSGMT